jgi:hypothetical protein
MAAIAIGILRLRWVQNAEALRTRKLAHAGSGREIVRVLGTAMQHRDQRQILVGMVWRHIELVVPCQRRVCMRAVDERVGDDGLPGRFQRCRFRCFELASFPYRRVGCACCGQARFTMPAAFICVGRYAGKAETLAPSA